MSADRLSQLIALAREHDPALAGWLCRAVSDWRKGAALETALGLRGTAAMVLRDAAIREAAALMDPKGQLSTWARAEKLGLRIAAFRTSVWPRYRDNPDAETLGVNGALVAAFRAGRHVPRSPRQLFDILQNQSRDCRKAA
ncbi:MAG: hypothetical protein JJU06_06690 [Ectothiorhodospiraceae bacterium]|nr:hypothetical protein [Ectothiorhodospiraceae bacterium]MCH8504721.1 hypothetical protein [Ectothiorhodospiraceae bacterium]